MVLTYKIALISAYELLKIIADKYQTLIHILSDMDPYIWNDRCCADPALWESWLQCAKKIKPDEKTIWNENEIFNILLEFLKIHQEEYSDWEDNCAYYNIDFIYNELKHYLETGDFGKIILNILNDI